MFGGDICMYGRYPFVHSTTMFIQQLEGADGDSAVSKVDEFLALMKLIF